MMNGWFGSSRGRHHRAAVLKVLSSEPAETTALHGRRGFRFVAEHGCRDLAESLRLHAPGWTRLTVCSDLQFRPDAQVTLDRGTTSPSAVGSTGVTFNGVSHSSSLGRAL
jgi:hypothetical protein